MWRLFFQTIEGLAEYGVKRVFAGPASGREGFWIEDGGSVSVA
jgi:hypothetical protein